MSKHNDPIGQAILDYTQSKKKAEIIVSSDLCDDDVIDVPYLFRSWKDMPSIKKKAINACNGKTLDIGAGAGAHSIVLKEKGLDVTALEPSEGATSYLKNLGLKTIQGRIEDLANQKYDTLLLMMNGLGLAGSLENLPTFLNHLKSLLNPDGKIICDSTDIIYLYQEEDGSMWMDLNAAYYGNFKFQMKYKDHQTEWFDWLYIDFARLQDICEEVGLSLKLLYEEDDHYLVELKIK